MKKKGLKIISIALIMVMFCASSAFAMTAAEQAQDADMTSAATVTVTGGAAEFPADVPGSAYENAVMTLIEAGAITGDSDGLFHPTDSLTRAQACIILVKAIDPPSAEVVGTATQKVSGSGFTDMKGYGWADGYVSYAVKHGIVKGYPDGTFKPANKVTCNEMMAMALRAAGYTDAQIGTNWPADYIAKANEVGITAGIAAPYPDAATKEIAAQMVYNKLADIKAAEEPAEPAEESEKEGNLPGVTALTFATGKFNDNMTAYGGTPISDDVVVYTYGVKANYKSDMKLPEKESELRADTIQKFKLADTPCFYSKTGGEITMMVLPMDAGFTGRIYGVINGSSQILNGKGEKVDNIHTLAAAHEVSWLTKDDAVSLPASSEYLAGEVYEMAATDGMVKNIVTVASGQGNKNFVELTSGQWDKVKSFKDAVVSLDVSDEMFEVGENATVYLLSEDGKSYSVGKRSDIKTDVSIRAYSISEDEEVATIITVKK